MSQINLDELRDRVRGCWIGKNIGGTLGAPFEGKRDLNDITFYTQKHDGQPIPNDDLDLQLVWLSMAERYGAYHLNHHLMGEYWLSNILGPWNEYAICKRNVAAGFYPPLSGACNNDQWKTSNGAWIRSEIWACLFPGQPDEAIKFAYLDACSDHAGEGIYAEMFTAALESAAFAENDLRRLIAIALSKIPDDCRVHASIALACDGYDRHEPWPDARQKIVGLNEDLGWFQAPANVAFTVLGLLYGEGDFARTVCTAVNCGDDTDCTGATAGAVMGILLGGRNIPQEWIKPIGDNIITIAISPFGLYPAIPKTVSELTARVVALARLTADENPLLTRIAEDPTDLDGTGLDTRQVASGLWARSPYELTFPTPVAEVAIDYLDTPMIAADRPCRLRLALRNLITPESEAEFRWHFPESWSCSTPVLRLMGKAAGTCAIEMTVTPGTLSEAMTYVPLEVIFSGHTYPHLLNVPFQQESTTFFPPAKGLRIQEYQPFTDLHRRTRKRVDDALTADRP